MEKHIPEELYPLFWDADPRTIDPDGHADFVISRILDLTTPAALRWLERTYSREKILCVNEGSRRLDARSRNFWRLWYAAAP